MPGRLFLTVFPASQLVHKVRLAGAVQPDHRHYYDALTDLHKVVDGIWNRSKHTIHVVDEAHW